MLSSSIAAALCVGVATQSQADIYEFTFANGGCNLAGLVDLNSNGSYADPGDNGDTCTGVGDGLFTIVNAAGAPTQNTSYPYYADTDWGYGKRTQIGGSLVISAGTGTGTGTGTMTIDPFDFFASGSAVAADITFSDLDNANDGTDTLWLGNMVFDWNGTNGIPVSIVWDMTGLLAGLTDTIGAVVTGGSIPATNGMKGSLPIGASPIATTSFDTTPTCGTVPNNNGLCLGTNPIGTTPIVVDGTGVGGSPMMDGAFAGFNANFDLTSLTLAGYNDTTAPALTLSTNTLNLTVGDTFTIGNPSGVTITCTDAADGSDTAAAAANSDITFNSAVTTGTNTTASPGTFVVSYSCTDNASARAALSADPNNLGSSTVPADNTSAITSSQQLTVNVAGAGSPVITITGSTTVALEACTTYTDSGATASDPEDGDLTGSIVVTDATPIIGGGNEPNEGTYSIVYGGVTDSNSNAAPTQTRTVNVTDTIAPVVTIAGGNTAALESTACAAYASSLPTATVTDSNVCNPGTSPISTSSTVNCVVPDGLDTVVSNLLYTGSDTATTPNETTETLEVTVSRSEPVITLNGGGRTFDVGDTYDELGMDIHDVQDGDVTAAIVSGTASGITYTITDNIDMSVEGTYTVTYTATDSDSNAATAVTRSVKVGSYASGSNFSMLDTGGKTFGGTNDVVFDWDESELTDVASTNFNMTIASALPQPFNGFLWTAHHVRVFGPGSYSFDTTCTTAQLEAGISACNNPLVGKQVERFITMTVPANQVGVHILFDWNGNENIDVVNVWKRDAVWIDPDGDISPKNQLFDGISGEAPDVATLWKLVSTDFDSDGINGSPMVDGPFINFFANFNVGPATTTTRVPYTKEVDVEADFTSKPGAGSMGWLAIILSPIALLVAMRRKLK